MAKAIWTRHAAHAAPRSTLRRERVTVDLRGHGAVLNAIAQSLRMPVATLVRTAIAEWLDARSVAGCQAQAADAGLRGSDDTITKVTLRMSERHAAGLARAARAAELPQGFYVARLLDGQPPTPVPPDQAENRAALLRYTAALAPMSSDLQALMRAMRQASSREQAACSDAVADLSEALQRHLAATTPLISALTTSRRYVAGDPV
ncbi:hypothetical protein OOZ63_12105 [Paucibacter sp. PLA-PC-4]|uniref:hypothetical protein n=1 Tax=Paucibacter sp. PLA-PC-4 TaxID=2993655 RepID=UPI002249562A|nr:hypothetical protein [Paucibacter sp. PLA-PC-4]MCX2862583.1 hypothetical protein [Paucibacter sp. PLA-PC-4]